MSTSQPILNAALLVFVLGTTCCSDSVTLVAAQAVGAACFGVGYAAIALRIGTIWAADARSATGTTLECGGTPLGVATDSDPRDSDRGPRPLDVLGLPQ